MYTVRHTVASMTVSVKYTPSHSSASFLIDAVWNETIQAEGLRGLYRGFSPCMVRSVIANATSFVVYEWVANKISSSQQRGQRRRRQEEHRTFNS